MKASIRSAANLDDDVRDEKSGTVPRNSDEKKKYC